MLCIYEANKKAKAKNLTEPDAPIMKTKKGNYDTAYNTQVACTENQIITYASVVSQGNDKTQLIPAIKGVKKNTKTEIEAILADADYGNYDSFEFMDKENIKGYVPYRQMNTDFNKQPFHSVHFDYNSQSDEYTCPVGAVLTFKKERKNKERTYRLYQTDACKNCPVKHLCITAKKQTKRTINREVREHLREQMKQRLHSDEGKKMYLHRMHPVEAIFGHLKYNLGYTHFLLRGLKKVNAEFTLMCLTYNLRKLITKTSLFLIILTLTSFVSCHIGKMLDMSMNFCKKHYNSLRINEISNVFKFFVLGHPVELRL
jgi:hypothetical protein